MKNEVAVADLGRAMNMARINRDEILNELTDTLRNVRNNAFDTMSDVNIKSSTELFSSNAGIIINGIKMSDRYILGKAAKALMSKEGNGIDSGRLAAEYLDRPQSNISRAVNLSERVDGIDTVIAIPNINGEDKRVLEQFRDRMTAKPDISTVYTTEIKKYNDLNDDDIGIELPIYTILNEAYVLDDVITYCNPAELGKVNFRNYVKKTIAIVDELRSGVSDYTTNPWDVTRDMVEEYDAAIVAEQVTAEVVPEVETEITEPPVVDQAVEAEVVADVVVDTDTPINFFDLSAFIAKSSEEWCHTEKDDGEIVDKVLTHAVEVADEWRTKRKVVLATYHPDNKATGNDIIFKMMKSMDEIIRNTVLLQQLRNNIRLSRQANEEMKDMSERDRNMWKMRYREAQTNEQEQGE